MGMILSIILLIIIVGTVSNLQCLYVHGSNNFSNILLINKSEVLHCQFIRVLWSVFSAACKIIPYCGNFIYEVFHKEFTKISTLYTLQQVCSDGGQRLSEGKQPLLKVDVV